MTRPHSPSERTGLRRFLYFSVASVLICVALAVMLAAFNLETLNRYYYMTLLCSDDEDRRQSGLSYLVRHAHEPAVQDHARRMLRGADDPCFQTIVRGLSAAGVWGPQFSDGWVRYLVQRSEGVEPRQRAGIAVALGKLLWHRKPGWESDRIAPAIEKLLNDGDADVRLNALSAAACLPDDSRRAELLRTATQDPEPVIARHAWIFVGLGAAGDALPGGEAEPPDGPPDAEAGNSETEPRDEQVQRARRFAEHRLDPELSCPPPGPEGPTGETDPNLRRLAKLAAMATGSAEVEIGDGLPPLLRMHAVRASKSVEPKQLLPVFKAELPSLRDLGCVIAIERFSQAQCRELAKELIAEYDKDRRMAGAILGGMVAPDDRLMELLHLREKESTDWVVQQHYRLALAMHGEPPEGFDPANLLLKKDMPRTTVILALLYLGQLDGLDWLFRPFGSPPVDLRALLDRARYRGVLSHFVEGLPPFGVWAEPARQRFQVDVLRDWYLLNRPRLRFDAHRHRFTAEGGTGSS